MNRKEKLNWLRSFAVKELNDDILPFWREKSVDSERGGFYGEIDFNMNIQYNEPKGLILNARILWSFSAAYPLTKEPKDLELAHRAFNYLVNNFYDQKYGGYYWSLDSDGKPHDTKKQIYALAFTLYGFSEYYKITQNTEALERCKDIFHTIEKYAFDTKLNGYIEAFTREWEEIEDLRLSDIDMNEKKTMNTHLHIVEAYANLFLVWKDERLKKQLENLVNIFTDIIISRDDYHLYLFFDENWVNKSTAISYGHDIEAGWLIHESALIHGSKELIKLAEELVPKITDASLQGLSELGGLYHEGDRAGKHIDEQLEWWPQAEALVGLLNTYEITGDEKYLDFAIQVARFSEEYMVDKNHGEWHYRVDKNGKPLETYPKAGFWKCPYHNSRACIELIKRIVV
ncbi:MAG: AGE family epimerase/isomerase [Bacteroidales bacterium]|nr:AGE family epimerase/isomerase [Bacteroidales bacterium]MBN2820955.1 AGE family epimerase/isomerase [Bacteroidales bacterium]